ncbi:hypothetical protein GCM10023321_14790 [Pseudonocardia eucalypti]|uniref:2Fe-2S ferredoxin-type domain-containing protein n=2 Tax=Pseudonocardia eucalypti TaxID=648755 RepID=A0ABP9PSM6_9PSEU|nr:ferredoxin [Pseudonocardia eucalypti]
MSDGAAIVGRVRVLPADITFDVREGETVFRAAIRHGLRWPTICGGDGECGVCHIVVEDGADVLVERSAAESARLALGVEAGEPSARLACRTQVQGSATVRRRGVRERTAERALHTRPGPPTG